jgi:probable rRNA maturation factor
MSVYITDEYGLSEKKFPLSEEQLTQIISDVVEEAIAYVDCPFECSVEVLFTGDEEIRVMNRENRDIDKATDVLSFPMVEYETPGDFLFLEEDKNHESIDCFDPDSGELLLGDIVISLDHAISQAEEYGHSVKREVAFLTAHSMLHLFGYDHMDDAEREEMEKIQEEILLRKGYTRDDR